ncbi:Di-copper centre-containing protein [Ascobolus immersus RN42]|uniref:Di-copper centre-containing protein n=1 Tax=Ascobolus immersus RN42 TaxID=1160509 RepID=A0A3N4HT22_ASCIM|nr:Di-copper centre-containing protein [Ascobolus immersus RN42]
MRFLETFVTLAITVGSVVQAVPTYDYFAGPAQQTCNQPAIRKEWRTLSILERVQFIEATKCLHKKPALLKKMHAGTTTRFEDFATTHKLLTPFFHFTGKFLLWHRWFLNEYERALQTECFYKGTLPYWDYTIDGATANYTSSPIFSSEPWGFGGNGAYKPDTTGMLPPGFFGGGCVKDGPFKDWKFHVAPGTETGYVDRCLVRNFWIDYQEWIQQSVEDKIMEQKTFEQFTIFTEGTPMSGWEGIHGAGHFIVGGFPFGEGTAAEVYTANLEPTFYLHHANLDRIWAEWQAVDPARRQYDSSGSIRPRMDWLDAETLKTFPPAGQVTLSSDLSLGPMTGARGDIKVGQIMNTVGGGKSIPGLAGKKGVLCYKYAKSPKPKRK